MVLQQTPGRCLLHAEHSMRHRGETTVNILSFPLFRRGAHGPERRLKGLAKVRQLESGDWELTLGIVAAAAA